MSQGPVASNPRCRGGRVGSPGLNPQGKAIPTRTLLGAVWKLAGDGSPPRGPLPVVKCPRPGVEAAPSGAVAPAPPGVEMLPRGLTEAQPVLHTPGPSNAHHLTIGLSRSRGSCIPISQVMHSLRAPGPLAELLSPESWPQAPCCDTSSGSGHWHESWLMKTVYLKNASRKINKAFTLFIQ